MEYRLKYRDVPWGVALGVLPGKIIGSFFIKPWLNFKRDWKRSIRRWFARLVAFLIISVLFVLLILLVETASEGDLSKMFSDIWAWLGQPIPRPEPAIVDLATPANIIGNHR